MSFHSWLQNLRSVFAPRRGQGNHRRRVALRTAGYRPGIEVLEDRSLLAFSPITSFPVGDSPQAVVTADFNNDGQLDLATSSFDQTTGDGAVSVLLGSSGGTFQTAKTSATGAYPFSLTAGDFNADGKLDLATANYDGVSFLLGYGDGAFAAPVSLIVSEAYFWSENSGEINAGDLNADGNLDLVVAYYDSLSDGYVDVLLGHGDGTFAAAVSYDSFYGTIYSPALADFNGDGKVDVAVAGWQMYAALVLLGNGDGTLQDPRVFSTGAGSGANSVTAGDFNADGKLDLIATNYLSNSVSMLLGNGDGTFRAAQSFAAGNGPGSAAASDVNGDGQLDLVVTNSDNTSPQGGVSVLLGNGDGTLAWPITTATGGAYTTSVVVADFNGDGRPDAAANGISNSVAVLFNDGNWEVAPPPPSIGINDVSLREGASRRTTLFSFTVTLSAPSTQTVTVNFATADGAAAAGSDYVAKSGTVTFLPGETIKTITISVKGDKTREPNETFFVKLANASGATIADGQGLGTILNDDSGSGGGKKRTSTSAIDPALNGWLGAADKKRK